MFGVLSGTERRENAEYPARLRSFFALAAVERAAQSHSVAPRETPPSETPFISTSRRPRPAGFPFPVVAAAALALSAIMMGGGTPRGAQGLVLSGIGILLMAAPARSWP